MKKSPCKIVIDISGPDGNAYALMGYTARFCKQLGRNDAANLIDKMQSGDYEHLLKVFIEEFGEYVVLRRN